MAVSKKTNATKKTKEATPVDTKKKVTFAQEKRVKTFHKDKALLKRKATDDQEQPTVPASKKTKSAIRQAAAQQDDIASSDEDEESNDEAAEGLANDTVLDALTEEQEEALRKEILGDLVDDEEDSDEDSSDDDQDDNIGENDNVVSLTKNKKQPTVNKKTADVSSTSGWVYVGRIPDAFTEGDMRTYFEQFGDIAHLRISRNKRGRSRHYGFIEFVAQDVAEIVVETMHNYMLDGRLLQCKLIPLESRHADTFDNENKPKTSASAPIERQRKIRNKEHGMQTYITRAEQLVSSENKKRQQLKDLNIDYEFPGYAASKLQWESHFKAMLEKEVKANELLKKQMEEKNKAKAEEKSQPVKVTVS